jgi:hypothetical protein
VNARAADPLDGGDPLDELLGEGDLERAGRTECRAASDLLLDRGHDGRVGVAEDQRRVVAEEVAIGVAVNVLDPDPRAAGEVRRVRWREDGRPGGAAGHDPRGPLEQGRGAWCPGVIRVVKGSAGGPFGDGHSRIVPRDGG